ncbi:MAG: 2'-5' RNA ligase family protein, partial [bacterium]
MIRTFIAIEAPYEVKQVINDAQRYFSRWAYDGVSWTRPEGIHLTLKFLGDV